MKDSIGKADDASVLFMLVGRAFRYSRQAVDQIVRAQGITPAQHSILNRLKERPGLSGIDVARHTFISPQAAHVALRTLEQKGLIGRETAPEDGRTVLSVLSPAGYAIIDTCAADIREVARDLAASLTLRQRETLIELLSRYVEGSAE